MPSLYLQGIKKTILQRPHAESPTKLTDLDPVLKRIFSSRGIKTTDELDRSLQNLASPWLLTGMQAMVEVLINAVKLQKNICIVADFDADGATSCALAIKGLTLLGAKKPDFVVPNRFEYGYGLTPEIVALIIPKKADIILTVDNGISSVEGVLAAKQAGMQVLITDHHLPGNEIPAADAIVNPNLTEDKFPSKHLAGVGVMFYVLLALRIRLREIHWFERNGIVEPNLAQLLDYVALGTVADVVALDQINRILVHQGLLRIRAGQCHPGIKMLTEISAKQLHNLYATDLGFALAPRLNAAGRMDDMSLGIQCLITDSLDEARSIAVQLDQLNQDRKAIEAQMKTEAMLLLDEMPNLKSNTHPAGICLFDSNWHQGVIGILAGRVKERINRPVIAFAPVSNGEIKGSARSIPGVHIRDVLSEIATYHPNILSKFGGHAMAAGLTIKRQDYPHFSLLFTDIVANKLKDLEVDQKIFSDGELDAAHFSLKFAEDLQQCAVWGQGFPEPQFNGVFDVIQCRIIKQHHLKLVLRIPFSDLLFDGIAFFVDHPENWLGCRKITGVYKLDINEYLGQRSLQLQFQYLETLG